MALDASPSVQADAPLVTPLASLEAGWIDYNGHLNMAYYNVLFDRAVDHGFEWIGCGPAYRANRILSVYTAEIHVCYIRELHESDRVRTSFQLLDYDAKRLHVFQEMRHESGWLAATSEVLCLHVDMTGPKAAPFPPDIAKRIAALKAAHRHLPHPDRAGRRIAIGSQRSAGAASHRPQDG